MKTIKEDSAFGFAAQLTREEDVYNHGLTKRELFAAMAMQGYCSTRDTFGNTPTELAKMAILNADALINELNKE